MCIDSSASTETSQPTSQQAKTNIDYCVKQGLKGVGAKIVILEEASRLDRAVFTEVVVPLLGVKDTAVLAISTPLDENNFYSQMLELTQDDGVTPLFNVISVSLICDECKQKDLKGQLTCPHRQNEIPPCETMLSSLNANRN